MIKIIGITLSHLNRGKMYVSFISFSMIFVIFIRDIGIKLNVIESILVVILGLIITLIVGVIDKKFKIRDYEQEHITRQNPVIIKILKLLENEQQNKK